MVITIKIEEEALNTLLTSANLSLNILEDEDRAEVSRIITEIQEQRRRNSDQEEPSRAETKEEN